MTTEESDTYEGGKPTHSHRRKDDDDSGAARRGVPRDSWFDSKLLRILGVVYGLASPLAAWVIVSIYTHNTQVAILDLELKNVKERLNTTTELYTKLDALNSTIGKIQIDIATIKAKGNIP